MEENQQGWGGPFNAQFSDILSYEDAIKPGEKRIIFTGPRR